MRTTFALLLAAVTCVIPGIAQNTESYKLRLAPVATDIAMRENIAGSGMVTATLAGSKLTLSGTFEGMKGNATMAHIHQGTAAGVRGPKLLDLTVTKAMGGNLSGTFDLTPEQLDALKKGKWYVQIHSEKAPDGNLWGWILK
ncbi:MAG: CHRD domain-containing protein [Bryobacteraceae bacterium]